MNNPKYVAPLDSAKFSKHVRGSWAGVFYFKYLKKYWLVQLAAPWAWRKLHFLYQLSWIYGKARKFPIIPLANHPAVISKITAVQAEAVETPMPIIFSDKFNNRVLPIQRGFHFPEIYIANISNALITANTNLVVADSSIICHDLYDFSHDYTSEELNGRTYIWPSSHRIAWLMETDPICVIEHGACFTDACAPNYAHWLTEVLPRIHIFCVVQQRTDIDILINDGLHKNLLESLRLVAGDVRKSLPIPAGSCLLVQHLSLTSVTGYVPFERRTHRLKSHSHGRFSPNALLSMRKHILNTLNDLQNLHAKKIYIRRNSSIRNITNTIEIEKILAEHGFSIIEPEKLTFSQQAALFFNAEIVVGATGAAMANLIFCRPTTKIVIMISFHRNTSYWYWHNIACAVGNRVNYILGVAVTTGSSGIHSDYLISPDDLLTAIGERR